MDVLEPVKHLASKVTDVGVPSKGQAAAGVVDCRPARMKFRDEGYIPNNPKYHLLYYQKALRIGRKLIPPLFSIQYLTPTAGVTLGATASTTSCITIQGEPQEALASSTLDSTAYGQLQGVLED